MTVIFSTVLYRSHVLPAVPHSIHVSVCELFMFVIYVCNKLPSLFCLSRVISVAVATAGSDCLWFCCSVVFSGNLLCINSNTFCSFSSLRFICIVNVKNVFVYLTAKCSVLQIYSCYYSCCPLTNYYSHHYYYYYYLLIFCVWQAKVSVVIFMLLHKPVLSNIWVATDVSWIKAEELNDWLICN